MATQKGTSGTWKVGTLTLANGVRLLVGSGAPTNGTSGTGANKANKGSKYFDYTNGSAYVNIGTRSSPTWIATEGSANGVLRFAEVSLTNAEIKALRATPKTLVAAAGANTVLELVNGVLILKAGANVLTESTANLAVKYKDGSSTQISETVESTGFIDQAVDTLTTVRPKQDGIVATSIYANQPLVLHNLGAGEFAGNAAADATLRAKIAYRVWSTT